MSTGNKIFNWCRMPPEPPKNRHKKLLAGSLIFTVLSVSLFASWPLFNMSMMTGQADALVAPSVALSVAYALHYGTAMTPFLLLTDIIHYFDILSLPDLTFKFTVLFVVI